MGLNIRFIGGRAELKHLNLRKQGNEDDRVLAVDLKVVGEAHATVLNDLLRASPGEDLSGLFWSPVESNGEALRSYAIKGIDIDGEWPNRIVHIGAQTIRADVRKVAIVPRPGKRVDLVAQVSIEVPPETLLDFLVARIQDQIPCHIESDLELALEGAK